MQFTSGFQNFWKITLQKDNNFIGPLLSKYHYGFRKGFRAQRCLLAMLEKWKNDVDKGKVFGALLTDLSKALDCSPHELIIAKLNANVLRSTMNIVHGRKYFLAFQKAPYLGIFCLISFLVICSLWLVILVF